MRGFLAFSEGKALRVSNCAAADRSVMYEWRDAERIAQPSPISFKISAVCCPRRGDGLPESIGLPSTMIGVRIPGMVPPLA